ncbi:tetratricopeptide repeat protein [bacterium]|nr:tetratricopeptide repeat protein [bacterium]
MEKVLSIRWQILGCVMAILLMAHVADAQAPQPIDPEAGKVSIGANTMESSKLAKLTKNLDQAAQEFRGANFAAAVAFYDAALKLDPTLSEAGEKKALAQRLDEAQKSARRDLPAGNRERNRFLAECFRAANDYMAKQQYDKASQAFYKMWLTAGDYQGKTLSLYADARSKASTPAVKTAVLNGDAPLPPPPPAPAVSSTAVQAAPESVTESDPAIRLEVSRLLHLAKKAIDEGKLDEASRHIKRIQELSPDNAQARQLAEQLSTRGFDPQQRIQDLMGIANKLMQERRWTDAAANYQEVLKLDPKNHEATVQLAKAQREEGFTNDTKAAKNKFEANVQVDTLLKEARAAYNNKDLAKARECWNKALEIDPNNKDAKTWLEETDPAWATYQATVSNQAKQKARSEQAEKLLSSPIRIATEREIPLSDFMYLLSNTTPVELEYYIAQGADVPVMANFVDKSLRSILDTVLPPKGLTWSINDNNVITIEQKIDTRIIKLSPIQLSQVRSALDLGELQRNVWGQATPPSPQVEMKVDERTNLLIVSGSAMHIQRVESFLKSMPANATPGLDTRMYKIRPEDAQKIQALISTLIQIDSQRPLALQRTAFAQGDDLIIHDTPENLTKIEELLLDKKFIQRLTNEELTIANFSLVPRDVEEIQSDYINDMTGRIVEAIETFLYSQEGAQKASAEGRRLWFDESTLQLTIVDFPSNIDQVRKYIESLPELRKGPQQDVVFLEYAESDMLAPSLERILNLTTGMGGAGTSGNEVRFTLRRGDQREFAGATFRIIRVEQNDPQDRHDDTVEISINVPGIGPQQTTVQEMQSQLVTDYEITAEDVLPSSGTNGEGQARLLIRYIPQIVQQQISQARQQGLQGLPTPGGQPSTEEQGITINSFADLNAIVLRYENAELHTEAVALIKQLDKPTRQVEIETKFVEVNETRAKEFSSDFNVAGLGKGRSIDWDTQLINTRFAQDQDEFRDPFSPMIEELNQANLIKGTTAISMVFGSFPNLQWNLRLLEAEGILNIVNGPRVTALHGVQAEFRIEQYLPQNAGGTTTNNNTVQVLQNPLLQSLSGQNIQLATQDEAQNNNIATAVVLQVTPSITSDKNIILRQLTAELIDLDQNLGDLLEAQDLGGGTTGGATGSTFFAPVASPRATINSGMFGVKRKKIVTDARISNGGTIVLGGWTGERSTEDTSGVPLLRNMPYIGKLLFSREQRNRNRTTLLIFLTGWIVNTD